MKSIVISVLMLSMSLFFVSCENEGQPTENASDVETQILSKKPHDGDKITFTGDLVGSETVMGCCPNAGPTPIYHSLELIPPEFPVEIDGIAIAGIYIDGEIFMNFTGRQSPGAYLIKYWHGPLYLEIRGGVASKDKRTKILTVEFEQVPCEIWIDEDSLTTVLVDFTLVRDPLRRAH